MGEGIITENGQAVELPETGTENGGATVETVRDTFPATGSKSNPGNSAADKKKSNRKNREIPVLITPAETTAPEPEKAPRKTKAAKADPIITQAIIAIAGSGMMTAGKLLNDEKLWTPTTGELTGVAEPAARIIERLNATAAVSKYADYIALGVAVATMILPRLLATSGKKSKGAKPHASRIKTTSPYPANPEASPVSKPDIEAREEVSKVHSLDVLPDYSIDEILGGDDGFG